MKHFKFIILPILSLLFIFSCERDDICTGETPTTPRLIIDFIDNTDLTTLKAVTDLRIEDTEDNSNVVPEYNGGDSNQVILPLKTTTNSTQYTFYKDYAVNDNGTPDDTSDDEIDGNPDVITILYTRKDVYVSRACGYKTIFENVEITIEDDGDIWILEDEAIITNQTIENETASHWKFFH